MESAEWPGIVDAVEGWFNQPLPAKTATMWYTELRHYDADRVLSAFQRVVQKHESPFMPPLGVVLKEIRKDMAVVEANRETIFNRYRERVAALKERTDQFLLERGIDPDEHDRQLEAYYSPGTVCSRMCGGVGNTVDDTHCFHCGATLIPDTRPPELGGPVPFQAVLEASTPEPTA